MGFLLEVVCIFLQVYLVLLFAQAILSWFPAEPGSGLARISQVLRRFSDPLIIPLRRVVPRAGMFDLSFLVLFFGISILLRVLGCW